MTAGGQYRPLFSDFLRKGNPEMKKFGKTLLNVIFTADIAIGTVALIALIILTVLGVIWRRVFNDPFTWLEEVQLACMVWIVFCAGGPAFRYGNHVAIEMVVDKFPAKAQKAVEVLISVIVVFVLGFFFKESLGYIGIFVKSGRATSMLKIPYRFIYSIAPVMLVDMLISYFYSLFTGVKSEAKEAIEE